MDKYDVINEISGIFRECEHTTFEPYCDIPIETFDQEEAKKQITDYVLILLGLKEKED